MRFDPLSAEWLKNPYPHYAAIRDEAPVFWDSRLSAHLVTRHSDCLEVLRDAQAFATDPSRLGRDVPATRRSIQTMDPPSNSGIRQISVASIRAGIAAQDADVLQTLVAQRLSRLAEQAGPVDLVTDFSVPLCLDVICGLMGVSVPDPVWFSEVSERLVRGMDFGFRPEALGPSLSAREELSMLTAPWLESGAPSEFSKEMTAATDAFGLEIAANTVRVILHAGYSSMSRFLENLLNLLMTRREVFDAQGDRLSSPEGRAVAVEEVIRYDSPVQVTSRLAVRDLELSNVRIREGETVIALLGAANRDPSVFHDADKLDLTRRPNPHLSFGRGAHGCLGAKLSIDVGAAVLDAFLNSHRDSSPAGPATRRDNASLRGFAHLPVRLVSRGSGRERHES